MLPHRIYRPAKTATQSGDWHGHHWRMDWDILSKGHRWENPLMGWQSSADCMQGTHINFKSREDAIHFAEKQGYEYFVQEPNVRRILPKAYANNFMHSPTKLKHIRTKWRVVKFLYYTKGAIKLISVSVWITRKLLLLLQGLHSTSTGNERPSVLHNVGFYCSFFGLRIVLTSIYF